MPLNIQQALGCVFAMVRNRTYDREMVGRVTSDGPFYKEGDIVLFTDDEKGRTVTVKTPYCQEEINRQRSEGSYLTHETMINFPRRRVERVAA